MGHDSMAGLFNVNRSVTNLGGGGRAMRLPASNPFPKLDQPPARPVVRNGGVALSGDLSVLPEMASDVLGVDAGYAVENVKRDRLEARPAAKIGFAQLVGRMLGSARPEARL